MICVLMEVDEGSSLGGSCLRDLVNIANTTTSGDSQNHVFTHAKLSADERARFPDRTWFHVYPERGIDPLSDIRELVSGFVSTTLCVVVSGHGYQCRDDNGDELDGMDEYVRIRGRVVRDDHLRQCFVENTHRSVNVVLIADTCHSGTMFDLDWMWSGKAWVPASKIRSPLPEPKRVVSVGACRDNQLEHCDVGHMVGYGGALCVHLIEKDLLVNLFRFDTEQLRMVYDGLMATFRLLQQEPIVSCSWKD